MVGLINRNNHTHWLNRSMQCLLRWTHINKKDSIDLKRNISSWTYSSFALSHPVLLFGSIPFQVLAPFLGFKMILQSTFFSLFMCLNVQKGGCQEGHTGMTTEPRVGQLSVFMGYTCRPLLSWRLTTARVGWSLITGTIGNHKQMGVWSLWRYKHGLNQAANLCLKTTEYYDKYYLLQWVLSWQGGSRGRIKWKFELIYAL